MRRKNIEIDLCCILRHFSAHTDEQNLLMTLTMFLHRASAHQSPPNDKMSPHFKYLRRMPKGVTTNAPSTPATLSKQRSTLSKQHSTLSPQTATVSNDSIVKFRPFDKVECCIDNVAVFGNVGFGNNVEATFDIVERIVQLVAFDNVAWTLLLVWTGLKYTRGKKHLRFSTQYCI